MILDARLLRIQAAASVTGWTTQVKAAHGSSVPLAFSEISYAGQTPTTASGITFRLLVKGGRTDTDAAALTSLTNAGLTITTAPLKVGAVVDTSATGYLPGSTVYGELWADDATYGRHLLAEFQITLSDPIREIFA